MHASACPWRETTARTPGRCTRSRGAGSSTALVGFPLYGELGRDAPAIVDAVASGKVDVGIVWGPVAAYGATQREGIVVNPIAEREDDGLPFTFAMAMGVRKGDKALAQELDRVLVKRRDAIARVVHDAHVPEVGDAPR